MKFRLHEKLKYMFFGGLLVFSGFMFGSMGSHTAAQSQKIDELRVGTLEVMERIVLFDGTHPVVHIYHDAHGGRITTTGRDITESGMAAIGLNENGGHIAALSKEMGGVLIRSSEDMNGVISVLAVGDKQVVKISDSGTGGHVSAIAKTGKGVASLLIFEDKGVVLTRDEFGKVERFPIE